MKIRCEYCNNYIDESEEKCPSCGAPNANYKRVGNQVPTTIEELKQWYFNHNLPPSLITRFFIGEDFRGPRAFGIYKDSNTGKYVVYKNKDTGERAIRYEGNDEAYAVNELYLKLKEEIARQKYLINNIRIKNINFDSNNSKKSSTLGSILSLLFFFAFFGMMIYITFFLPYVNNGNNTRKGYYYINNNEYYYGGGNWFIYANDDWVSSSEPNYSGKLADYYQGDVYSDSADYSNIRDSSVYSDSWDYSSSNNSSWGSRSSSSYDDDDDDWDWDSGSDWDSDDSWDSGSTDWGSDW